MEEEAFRHDLRLKGFADPVLVERDAAYCLDIHSHPFEAYALILDGEIAIDVNGVNTVYRASETFSLPPDCPHRESAGPAGVKYLSGRKEKA